MQYTPHDTRLIWRHACNTLHMIQERSDQFSSFTMSPQNWEETKHDKLLSRQVQQPAPPLTPSNRWPRLLPLPSFNPALFPPLTPSDRLAQAPPLNSDDGQPRLPPHPSLPMMDSPASHPTLHRQPHLLPLPSLSMTERPSLVPNIRFPKLFQCADTDQRTSLLFNVLFLSHTQHNTHTHTHTHTHTIPKGGVPT